MSSNRSQADAAGRKPNETSDLRLGYLEALVDELIKDRPNEDRVKHCMLAAGLRYSKDSIERLSNVLEEIENVKITESHVLKGRA